MIHSVKLQSVDSIPQISVEYPHLGPTQQRWSAPPKRIKTPIKCDASFHENWGDPVFMATETSGLKLETWQHTQHWNGREVDNPSAFPEEKGRGWWENWDTEQQYLHSLPGGREVFVEPHVLYGHLWEVRGAGGHTQQALTDPERTLLKRVQPFLTLRSASRVLARVMYSRSRERCLLGTKGGNMMCTWNVKTTTRLAVVTGHQVKF